MQTLKPATPNIPATIETEERSQHSEQRPTGALYLALIKELLAGRDTLFTCTRGAFPNTCILASMMTVQF